ncbi:MAG: type II toxin-antitoxin system PrlF family antitoxin [Candidatus Eremiobacteraeota bacterium]|nr:type II toxin-antitoxin system PrlF family antitoxin [Candidatus Eremiobacteraeota bacterium]
MPQAKITSKGQITIPKSIRERLRVGPGDRVAFRVENDGVVTVNAATLDLRSLIGSVKSSVQGVTIEQMNEGIGEAIHEEFQRSVQ